MTILTTDCQKKRRSEHEENFIDKLDEENSKQGSGNYYFHLDLMRNIAIASCYLIQDIPVYHDCLSHRPGHHYHHEQDDPGPHNRPGHDCSLPRRGHIKKCD